jgi:DNA-binding LytR/AlgR family response regulator
MACAPRSCSAIQTAPPHECSLALRDADRRRTANRSVVAMSEATALIADDEPLLRERLRAHLARLWPELQIVAEARNGREAVELFDQHLPAVVFLDVQMPGLNGVEAARSIGRRAAIVFVTAHEQYAVQAFTQGALDYLVKPFDADRLADTVQRLKDRLARPAAAAGGTLDAVLDGLASELKRRAGLDGPGPRHLRWIKASVGSSTRLIPVEQIAFMRSDEKYTLVVWEGGEALIRKTIRELADELDPESFAQIHRSVIVNLRQVSQVDRGINETAEVKLKNRKEVLPVSRSFVHIFRQM